MSRLSELIRDLCPDGVEFKTLEEIFVTRNGYTPRKGDASAWESGDVPWFRMEDIRENGGILSNARTRVSLSAVKGGRVFPANSILVATSATIGAHALITVPHLSNQRFTSLQLKEEYCGVFDHKFLYYYCFLLDEHCLKNVHVSSFASVGMRAFRSFRFPVVPLEVQQEIVRILDQFTTLEAELEAELEARRKQYEHYREQLMRESSVGDVVFKTLEELFVTRNGYTPRKNDASAWETSDIPWFRMEDIRENGGILSEAQTYVSSSAVKGGRVFPANSILVATSATIGAHALITVPHLSNQRFTSLQLKEEYRGAFDHKFLYYYCFLLDEHCLKNTHVSSFASVEMKAFKSFKFPMAPVEVQREIVRILDHFTTLEADLETELEARHKQYEYYRNMVLTFPERRR